MSLVTTRRSTMTLFSGQDCPLSHMVRIVLAEKNINHDVVQVVGDDTPEELKELNPYDEVPTLVDRDLVLYDPHLIMEYLDERFPHPPLMPVDPVSRATSRLMLYRIRRDWYARLPDIAAGGRGATEARKLLRDSLTAVSPLFEQQPFFLNTEFTLVDAALLPLLWRLPALGVELPPAAKAIRRYAGKMFRRESFGRSLTEVERQLPGGL